MDSFVISAGERFDFVLNARQDIGSYWIRFHGLMDCSVKHVFQAAILDYEETDEMEPEDLLTYENTWRPGKVKTFSFYSLLVYKRAFMITQVKRVVINKKEY